MQAPPEALCAALASRYEVERELGQGGMATVYLARDLKHRRQVAIKIVRPDVAAALGSERFLREIDVAAASCTATSSLRTFCSKATMPSSRTSVSPAGCRRRQGRR